jgi:biopolymer transport protein ExbD
MNPIILRKDRGLPASFLDVILVVLLLFILLSSLVTVAEQESHEKSLPPIDLATMDDGPDATPGLSSHKPLVISVAAGPVFHIDAKPSSFEDIEHHLRNQRPGEVEIRGDVRVPYGEITQILKLCQETGNSRISLTYKKNGK